MTQDEIEDAARPRSIEPTPPPSLPRWLMPLLAILIAFAFRGLAGYQPEPKLYNIRGAERWFFVVSETSPYLVYVVSAWLFVVRRRTLEAALAEKRHAARGPSPGEWCLAGGLLAPALALYLWAYHVGAMDLLIPAFALSLLGGAALLGGGGAARCLLFPCAFLVFAIPLPAVLVNLLVFPLQLATAQLAGALLGAIGVEVALFGDFIITSQQVFHVIETCSGLRGIETLVMASVLYIDIAWRNRVHAALIIASAPLIAFMVNGLRVVTIVLNPLSEIVAIHTLQGVVVLVLGVFSLVLVDRALVRLPYLARRTPRMAERPHDVGSLAGAPPPLHVRAFDRRVAGFAVTLAALAFAPLWLPHWSAPESETLRLHQQLPPALGEWRAKRGSLDPGYLGTLFYDDYAVRRYQVAEREGDLETEVTLFAARHRRLDRRNSLISEKTRYPGIGARLKSRTPVRIAGRFDGELLIFRTSRGRRAVYHWDEAADSAFSEVARSFFALDRGFTRRPEPVEMFRLSTPLGRGPRERERAIERLDAVAAGLSKSAALSEPGR